jgi:hypothetical protein
MRFIGSSFFVSFVVKSFRHPSELDFEFPTQKDEEPFFATGAIVLPYSLREATLESGRRG